jgi:hypothetical protein
VFPQHSTRFTVVTASLGASLDEARLKREGAFERLWRRKNDPAQVVAALRADRALSEPLRQAALRAPLRRVRP